jgi:ferritin-like protein
MERRNDVLDERPERGETRLVDRSRGGANDPVTGVMADEDAGVASAEDIPAPSSRADLLRRALLAGGAVVAGGVVTGLLSKPAASAPSRARDIRILNFLLVLEYLQAQFYSEASKSGVLHGELKRLAEVVGGHERSHVALLKKRLGKNAVKEPNFQFGVNVKDERNFMRSAAALEEAVTAAYIGQGANLTADAAAAVVGIVAVEGRHAAWIRDILGKSPAPSAADPAKTPVEATAAIRAAGFAKTA